MLCAPVTTQRITKIEPGEVSLLFLRRPAAPAQKTGQIEQLSDPACIAINCQLQTQPSNAETIHRLPTSQPMATPVRTRLGSDSSSNGTGKQLNPIIKRERAVEFHGPQNAALQSTAPHSAPRLAFDERPFKTPKTEGTPQHYVCGYCGIQRFYVAAEFGGIVNACCGCGGSSRDMVPRLHTNWVIDSAGSLDSPIDLDLFDVPFLDAETDSSTGSGFGSGAGSDENSDAATGKKQEPSDKGQQEYSVGHRAWHLFDTGSEEVGCC